MNPWTVLQLASAAIAIISLIGGEKLSLPILAAAGIALFGGKHDQKPNITSPNVSCSRFMP